MPNLRFPATLAVALLVLAGPASAQEDASLGAKETVLRVMQLTQELEKLLASLPPETQEEMRGLLKDRLTTTSVPEDAELTAQPPTPAAADPQPYADTIADSPPAATPTDGAQRVNSDPKPVATAATAQVTEAAEAAPSPAAPAPTIADVSTIERAAQSPPTPAVSRQSDLAEEDSAPDATPPATPRRGACRTMEPFDTDADGKLTGLDRYWRHFHLWTDVNENGSLEEREIESPYDRGIREIEVGLRSFVRGKGKRKRALEIQLEEYILLDVGGDGWSGADPRGDDGALAVDASAVRKAGGPDLRDGRGRPLEGVHPFRPGWTLRLGDGTEIVANCPKG